MTTTSTDLTFMARRVQQHVPEQPWSRHGNRAVPLEITFNGNPDDGGPQWTIRFVVAVRGERRMWKTTHAPDLAQALEAARQIQQVWEISR